MRNREQNYYTHFVSVFLTRYRRSYTNVFLRNKCKIFTKIVWIVGFLIDYFETLLERSLDTDNFLIYSANSNSLIKKKC